ncbi:SIMPL domain-containing protein [Streptomyces sp. NPDC051322]|uniref:SIMPL domain-containing protein n=1 Tax=Streptomyces sp. NPDC051322 TaxID=3154645 RepID=UPI00344F423E
MTDEAPPHTQAAPYGTPDVPRVAVRGEARLEVDPETARISVTVSARGKDRRAALDDLTRRNAWLLDLAKSYGPSVENIETGTFSVTPEPAQHGRGERIRAYHGRVHTTLVLNDFTALGELITRIADLDMTRISGPWWSLRPDSPAHGEARRQAVREAVQRAREYADALGARLSALVELADLGAENTAPAPGMPAAPGSFRARAAYGGSEAEAPAALDLEPQRQTVYAQVNARFTMTPPKL